MVVLLLLWLLLLLLLLFLVLLLLLLLLLLRLLMWGSLRSMAVTLSTAGNGCGMDEVAAGCDSTVPGGETEGEDARKWRCRGVTSKTSAIF